MATSLHSPNRMVSGEPFSSTGLSSRIAAPLAYSGWWITGVILWLVERRDPYVRFHAAQSVAAFGLVAALIAAFAALAIASLSLLPSASTLFVGAAALTWVGGMLLWVVTMWKAASGDAWRIPVAAALAERLITRRSAPAH